MAEGQDRQGSEVLPETFHTQVKDALDHLHNLGYLQRHPLAREGELATKKPTAIAGQRLRRELVDAIEALNPGRDVPFNAPHARLYHLLTMHYVDGMTIQETAYELGLSTRQTLRGLRQGEKEVAAVLWARRQALPLQEAEAIEISSLHSEMTRLKVHFGPTDLDALLQRVQGAVEPQAMQRCIRFQAETSPGPVILSSDPMIAEQILLTILSHAVGQAQPGILHLRLAANKERARLTLSFIPEPEAANALVADHVITGLADRLQWVVEQKDRPEGMRTITVHMATQCPSVLVVDDNEGLISLLERFLAEYACQVIAATNGQEGLRLAQELLPDAIVLDVMMPEMHGWEVLQRLRIHPQTADIPVIICSVIKNPELATALGASFFLPKPVRQDDILTALRQLGVV